MRGQPLKSLPRVAALVGIALLAPPLAVRSAPKDAPLKDAPLSEAQKVRHVLDRIGFGPRPGDVERVRRMGLDRYIDQQLRPEEIPEPRVEQSLRPLSTLTLPSDQLTEAFRNGLRPVPGPAGTQEERQARRRQAQQEYRAFLAGVVGELQAAKVYRAVESDRQLYEVMVDFWTNHFNIDVRKGAARALKTADDREVVRAHALGRFRDLLGASARSPAMLVYLDNARSSAPAPAGRASRRARGGLNENYARELMELHTLGVDGGYTQKDVVEVARCLTGWTVDPRTGRYLFTPRRHDNGEKTVRGHAIPAGGGIGDGERVLDILASHPSTARHIARKLCQRLAADRPPAALVDRAAKAFRETDGDIRAVVRAIVTAKEFYGPSVVRSKVKSPFEYVVSAVRALDGHVDFGALARGGQPLVRQIALMGEPLFQYQAPTGYPEDSQAWASAGSLVARLNFALGLAHGTVPGVRLAGSTESAGGSPDVTLRALQRRILPDRVSDTTRSTIMKQAAAHDGEPDAALLAALALGSPEFQRR